MKHLDFTGMCHISKDALVQITTTCLGLQPAVNYKNDGRSLSTAVLPECNVINKMVAMEMNEP